MGEFDLTNDCIAYINKLEQFATNSPSGSLMISASGREYSNTNYLLDDVAQTGFGGALPAATNALLAAGVPAASIMYLAGTETCIATNTNGQCIQWQAMPHITNAVNVAGYSCWGAHSTLENRVPGERDASLEWRQLVVDH